MDTFIIDFATTKERWSTTFEGPNKSDVLVEAKRFADRLAKKKETTLFFSFREGNRLYHTDNYQICYHNLIVKNGSPLENKKKAI